MRQRLLLNVHKFVQLQNYGHLSDARRCCSLDCNLGRWRREHNYNDYNHRVKFGQYIGVFGIGLASALGLMRSTMKPVECQSDVDGSRNFDDDILDNTFFPESTADKPTIKVLVVDGGGLRGVMPMQILKTLEEEIQKEAGDDSITLDQVFDMIVGTSTGGLIALGLGKLHWNCNEIDEFYDKVAVEVFGKDAGIFSKITNTIWSAMSGIGFVSALDTEKLEEILKNEFGEQTVMKVSDDKLKDEPFISLVSVLSNNYHSAIPVLIKNYDLTTKGFVPFGKENKYNLPALSQCKLWEAARATTAAPTYFDAVDIPMPNGCKNIAIQFKICDLMGFDFEHLTKKENMYIQEKSAEILHLINNKNESKIDSVLAEMNNNALKKSSFNIDKNGFMKRIYSKDYKLRMIDGGINHNAPCLYAYVEACRMWPQSNIQILSVGTGKPAVNTVFSDVEPPTIYLQQVFNEMFDGKEKATLLPLISLAASSYNFNFMRINPNVDPSQTDMADASLMTLWREIGRKHAMENYEDIKLWAKYLVNEMKHKDNILHKFYERKAQHAVSE